MVEDSNVLIFGDMEILYSITRTKRKTVGIVVEPGGIVYVKAPLDLETEKIQEAVNKKKIWIVNKLKKDQEIVKPVPLKHELVSGEKIRLKNNLFRLKITPTPKKRTHTIFAFRTLTVYVDEKLEKEEKNEEIKRALMKWYKERALSIISERIEKYEKYLEIKPNGIKIRDQKVRWGTCTPERTLIFNWRIVMGPVSAIDYVVVHELCHIQDPTHSNKFWTLVGSLFPNYKKWKEWLRVNGPILDLRLD